LIVIGSDNGFEHVCILNFCREHKNAMRQFFSEAGS